MLKRFALIILAAAVMGAFGCKKMEESGVTIDKAISVLEAAKMAEKMINAGNAKSTADSLMKEIENDKD